ncbi:MAG: aminomethyl-transferring glycine dehydrogenase subunit GcvPA [Candidatus Diapherotrites archaeon]|nr:aminomethyl-transferring glycine dehydrogenase subunit GcvPA [Candidatus Diapherotrites archaeon]
MDFVPHTEKQAKEMLRVAGVSSVEGLFKDIPQDKLLKEKLKLPDGMPEQDLVSHVRSLAEQNHHIGKVSGFLGAGCYNHFIPSAVWHLAGRAEFYTAYTPYQPEISQGMLQAIFEYQTMVCELFGMDVANASLYDGGSALAEAMMMGVYQTGRKEVVYSKAINPDHLAIAKTYAGAHNIKLVEADFEGGTTGISELEKKVNENTATVLVQNPNFFGCVEDLKAIEKIVHAKGALFAVSVSEPVSLGMLKAPGECNADIVCGEGQSFGIPMSFGGPYVGMIATKMEFVRRLPGRICGKTIDTEGKEGFILTLQAREQHIRREKATSNICTNQALCALAATIHLSLLGKKGLQELAELNLKNAHYAAKKIGGVRGFELAFRAPFFNEFVVKCPDAEKSLFELEKKGILAGINLGKYYPEFKNHLLVCATEMNSKAEIDALAKALAEVKFA